MTDGDLADGDGPAGADAERPTGADADRASDGVTGAGTDPSSGRPAGVVAGWLRRTGPWLLASLAILGATAWAIGTRDLAAALGRVSAGSAGAVLGALLVMALFRGVVARIVFGALGSDLGPLRGVEVYLGAAFATSVTPSGQAGGVPVAGLIAARLTDVRYETGCAGVTAVNLAGNVVLLTTGAGGAAWLLAAGDGGETLRVAALSAVLLLAALLAGIVAIWRFREVVGRGTTTALTPLARVLGRLPGLAPPDREAVADRVRGFGAAFDRLAAVNRRALVGVVVATLLAHAASVGALWLALRATGAPVAAPVLLAVVPLAFATAVAPLPGGLGSVEATLIALIVAVSGSPGAAVGAGVVVYRGFAYALGTVGGGAVALVVFAPGVRRTAR